MHVHHLLPTFLLAAAHLTSACGPVARQEQSNAGNNATLPSFVLGEDVPSDPATLGYMVNHFCVNVKNADESVEWYSKVFGLRKVFKMQVSEHFSISYMGHSAGGRNGTGFETTDEMNRDKNNRYGMLELVSIEGVGWDVQTTSNGLHHGGIIVPDIEAFQKRLDGMEDVKVVKAFGEPATTDTGPYAAIAALDQAEQDAIFAAAGETFLPLIFVEDPNGNVWEVQGQEGFGLG